LVAQFGGGFASTQIIEDLYLVDPLSDEVQKAGFREAESLRTALLVLQRNGPVQQLFEQKLRGCSKSRYDQERETLFDLREWYIGKYDALCDDDGSKEERGACKVANDLDRKAGPSLSSGSNASGKFYITFRSDKQLDRVKVTLDKVTHTMSTGPKASVPAKPGARVFIQWRADPTSAEPDIEFDFQCCDKRTIELESEGRVTVKKTSNAIEIWFKSDDRVDRESTSESGEISICNVYYPKKFYLGDKPFERTQPLSDEGVTTIVPKTSLHHKSFGRIEVGSRLPKLNLYVAAIGDASIVLLPTDTVTSLDFKNVLERTGDLDIMKIEFDKKPIPCRVEK